MHEPEAAKRRSRWTRRSASSNWRINYARLRPRLPEPTGQRRRARRRLTGLSRVARTRRPREGERRDYRRRIAWRNSRPRRRCSKSSGAPIIRTWRSFGTRTTPASRRRPRRDVQQLGRYVRHTHLKDSRAPKGDEKARRYVLTGSGEVPVKETVKVLAAGGYRGYYGFGVGEEMASRDRRAGGRDPSLRESDAPVPGRGRH